MNFFKPTINGETVPIKVFDDSVKDYGVLTTNTLENNADRKLYGVNMASVIDYYGMYGLASYAANGNFYRTKSLLDKNGRTSETPGFKFEEVVKVQLMPVEGVLTKNLSSGGSLEKRENNVVGQMVDGMKIRFQSDFINYAPDYKIYEWQENDDITGGVVYTDVIRYAPYRMFSEQDIDTWSMLPYDSITKQPSSFDVNNNGELKSGDVAPYFIINPNTETENRYLFAYLLLESNVSVDCLPKEMDFTFTYLSGTTEIEEKFSYNLEWQGSTSKIYFSNLTSQVVTKIKCEVKSVFISNVQEKYGVAIKRGSLFYYDGFSESKSVNGLQFAPATTLTNDSLPFQKYNGLFSTTVDSFYMSDINSIALGESSVSIEITPTLGEMVFDKITMRLNKDCFFLVKPNSIDESENITVSINNSIYPITTEITDSNLLTITVLPLEVEEGEEEIPVEISTDDVLQITFNNFTKNSPGKTPFNTFSNFGLSNTTFFKDDLQLYPEVSSGGEENPNMAASIELDYEFSSLYDYTSLSGKTFSSLINTLNSHDTISSTLINSIDSEEKEISTNLAKIVYEPTDINQMINMISFDFTFINDSVTLPDRLKITYNNSNDVYYSFEDLNLKDGTVSTYSLLIEENGVDINGEPTTFNFSTTKIVNVKITFMGFSQTNVLKSFALTKVLFKNEELEVRSFFTSTFDKENAILPSTFDNLSLFKTDSIIYNSSSLKGASSLYIFPESILTSPLILKINLNKKIFIESLKCMFGAGVQSRSSSFKNVEVSIGDTTLSYVFTDLEVDERNETVLNFKEAEFNSIEIGEIILKIEKSDIIFSQSRNFNDKGDSIGFLPAFLMQALQINSSDGGGVEFVVSIYNPATGEEIPLDLGVTPSKSSFPVKLYAGQKTVNNLPVAEYVDLNNRVIIYGKYINLVFLKKKGYNFFVLDFTAQKDEYDYYNVEDGYTEESFFNKYISRHVNLVPAVPERTSFITNGEKIRFFLKDPISGILMVNLFGNISHISSRFGVPMFGVRENRGSIEATKVISNQGWSFNSFLGASLYGMLEVPHLFRKRNCVAYLNNTIPVTFNVDSQTFYTSNNISAGSTNQLSYIYDKYIPKIKYAEFFTVNKTTDIKNQLNYNKYNNGTKDYFYQVNGFSYTSMTENINYRFKFEKQNFFDFKNTYTPTKILISSNQFETEFMNIMAEEATFTEMFEKNIVSEKDYTPIIDFRMIGGTTVAAVWGSSVPNYKQETINKVRYSGFENIITKNKTTVFPTKHPGGVTMPNSCFFHKHTYHNDWTDYVGFNTKSKTTITQDEEVIITFFVTSKGSGNTSNNHFFIYCYVGVDEKGNIYSRGLGLDGDLKYIENIKSTKRFYSTSLTNPTPKTSKIVNTKTDITSEVEETTEGEETTVNSISLRYRVRAEKIDGKPNKDTIGKMLNVELKVLNGVANTTSNEYYYNVATPTKTSPIVGSNLNIEKNYKVSEISFTNSYPVDATTSDNKKFFDSPNLPNGSFCSRASKKDFTDYRYGGASQAVEDVTNGFFFKYGTLNNGTAPYLNKITTKNVYCPINAVDLNNFLIKSTEIPVAEGDPKKYEINLESTIHLHSGGGAMGNFYFPKEHMQVIEKK